MTMFRRWMHVFMLAALGITLGVAKAGYAQTYLDSILVVIDDEVITQTELETHLRNLISELRQAKKPIPEDRVLQRQGVEELIQQKLLLRQAKRLGIVASTADVDNAVRQVARQNGLTLEQLSEALKDQGLTLDAYRTLVRGQIETRGVIERMMSRQVRVDDSEIDLYLTSQKRDQQSDKELLLARILLPVPDDADAQTLESSQALAESIITELAGGAAFTDLAKRHSQGPEATNGGELGWRKGAQLPTLYTDAITELKPGDVSDLLRGGNGLHILKLIDQRDANVQTVEQLKIRQILISPNQILSDEEVEKRLLGLRERIEGGDDFATLARAHSQDNATRAIGGDMGWVTVQELPPSFQRVIKEIPVGQVSEPIRSAAGVHILKIEDTRLEKVSDDVRRKQARQVIVQRKRDDFFKRWTRELRDEAYVEFRIAL